MQKRSFDARLCLVGLLLGACGGASWEYDVVGTRSDPGAEGRIQVERIEGGNHLVTVSLSHVTPPERLSPNLNAFVLWFRDARGQNQMASVMQYDPNSRSARATATTPNTKFIVLVTAESRANASSPSENVIFRQQVNAE